MRTIIELIDTNCTWCRDAMIEHLANRPLVRRVHVNSTTGCLQVDHDHDSPAALMAEIRGDLRGWELADNGERIMVELRAHEVGHCPRLRGSPSSGRKADRERISPKEFGRGADSLIHAGLRYPAQSPTDRQGRSDA